MKRFVHQLDFCDISGLWFFWISKILMVLFGEFKGIILCLDCTKRKMLISSIFDWQQWTSFMCCIAANHLLTVCTELFEGGYVEQNVPRYLKFDDFTGTAEDSSCSPHFGSLLTGHVIRSNGTLALSYQSFMSCSQLIFQFTCGVESQRIKPRKDGNKNSHESKQKAAAVVFWMRVKSSIFPCECCCVQVKSEKLNFSE